MSLYAKHYSKSKELGIRLNWSRDQISEHAEEKTKKEVSELMSTLVDAFNTSNSDIIEAGILEGINKNHRFIQSEFWSGMVKVMKQYSEQDKTMFFDGRNEHCRDMCKRMASEALNY